MAVLVNSCGSYTLLGTLPRFMILISFSVIISLFIGQVRCNKNTVILEPGQYSSWRA
jgi:hypothetical protein